MNSSRSNTNKVWRKESPFEPGSKIVAYARDSGGDGQDRSVDQQKDIYREFCKHHKLVLSHVYADRAKSGGSTTGRDQFLQMVEDLHHPKEDEKVAGVIFWKLSRLARDLNDSQYYRAGLRRIGYVVHFLADDIPDAGGVGPVVESMHDWMNEQYLKELSTDVKRGLHYLVNSKGDDGSCLGLMPGTPPKGFKREPVVLGRKRNGEERVASRWVKDPETWDRCKLAWKMRATGSSYREVHSVTRLLGSLNSYPTFFSNEIYRGTQKFGETRNENCYPACCTPEQWDAVAKLRKDAREKRDSGTAAPRRGNYLLTGSLRCAYCGKPMVGSRSSSGAGKPYRYYICQTKHRAAKACSSKRLSANMVEGTVIDHMFENVLSLEGLRWLVEQYRARRKKSNVLEKRIASLKGELATHEAAIERLMDLAEAGGGQLLAVSERMSEHEADTLQIKGDLARLESEARSQLDFDLDDASLRRLAKKWRQELKKSDPDKARRVLKLFVREIRAYKQKGLAKYTSPWWESAYKRCAPTGVRTPVLALRGPRPGPLDDGGGSG